MYSVSSFFSPGFLYVDCGYFAEYRAFKFDLVQNFRWNLLACLPAPEINTGPL